jgi:hypothetical protein
VSKTVFQSLFSLLLLASASDVAAQQQRHVPVGLLTLSGYQVHCGRVATDIMPIADLAGSFRGRIILSPSLFDLPGAQQVFWYMHECGHQMVGSNEAAADCWAARQGRIQGWLSPTELTRLSSAMQGWSGDATHAEGGRRAKAMERCYYR